MDGENNGKPYFLMDDLGGKPTIFGNILISYTLPKTNMEPEIFTCLKRKIILPPPPFSGAMLVFGGVIVYNNPQFKCAV